MIYRYPIHGGCKYGKLNRSRVWTNDGKVLESRKYYLDSRTRAEVGHRSDDSCLLTENYGRRLRCFRPIAILLYFNRLAIVFF